MTYLPKLTGNNWYEWKKEVETYCMLIGCGEHLSSEKPGGEKVSVISEWEKIDQKVYAVIWFLVDPNHRSPIVATKSGKEAWDSLIAEYQKDSATNRLLLRQQFYSITHDPAIPVTTFIEDVFSIVRKLDAIGHKPSDLEVSDKLLIGLDRSWGPVRTSITLQSNTLTIDEITSALKQYEANESSRDLAVKKENGDSALVARGKGSRLRIRDENDDEDKECEDCDWGNSKNREGVCYRCGRPGHIARNCAVDMPAEVKSKVRKRSPNTTDTAIIATDDDPEAAMFAYSAVDTTSCNRSDTPYVPISLFDILPEPIMISPVLNTGKKKKRRPKR